MTDTAPTPWKAWKGKDPNWCPGCGDFGVLTAMQKAAEQLGLDPQRTVLATGIGCSGNITAYFRSFGIHGIHGRVLPLATGVKLADPGLTVLAAGGDGDGFGIGLGHFLHAARRNVDLTYLVMDNQVYGLTKGQTSPTTPTTMHTKASPMGPLAAPLNPLALALSAGATFVAQAFAGDQKTLVEIICRAVRHPGFAFVNIQSPCVTYNLVNTYDFFRTNTRAVTHDASDADAAMAAARATEHVPVGVLYEARRPTLGEALGQRTGEGAATNGRDRDGTRHAGAPDPKALQAWIDAFRVR